MQKLKVFMFLLLGVVMMECQLNEPSLPDWDTNVKVHFRPDRVYMSEVLTENSLKDSLLTGFPDTLIFLSIEDETEPQKINREDLGFKSDNEHSEEEIGIIHLDAPGTQITPDITLGDLFSPGLTIEAGATLPAIPPQTINPAGNKVNFNNFLNVVIDKADLFLVFYNDLILDLAPGTTISVYDSVSGLLVGEFVFDEAILAGESQQSSTVQLDGKTISNTFILEYSIPIAGTSGPILLTENAVNIGFRTAVNISAIDVTSASAKIPEQNFVRNGAYFLNTEDKSVKMATIDEGNIILDIQNNLGLDVNLDITILSMIKNNLPKIINLDILANQIESVPVNLAGYSIRNHLDTQAFVDSIYYEVTAKTDSSEEFVTVAAEDNIVIDMTMDSIFVSYMEGTVSNVKVEIEPIEESDLVDLSEIDGSFTLPAVVLTFDFFNEIGFDVDIELDVTAYHEDEDTGIIDSLSMHVSKTLAAGSSHNPEHTIVRLDSTDNYPNIVDLMALLPTSIKVTGSGVVDGPGTVSQEDAVWAKYTIESPLQISVDEPLFFTTDIDSIPENDIDSDARKRISEDLTDVYLVFNSHNGLPLATEMKFIISTDSTNLINQTEMASKNIVFISTVDAGITDANGLVVTPVESSDELRLTSEQLKIFESGALYYKAQIRLEESQGGVMFRKNDFYSYDGLVDIKFRVTTDDN